MDLHTQNKMTYTSDKTPSGLTRLTTLANDDVIIVGDTSDSNELVKAISLEDLSTQLGIADTFETVSKNLDASGATLAYTGDNLTSITYTNGIIKTLAYTGDNLTSVVLSGSTPAGINLTKTLSYTGDNLTGVAYT